MILYSFRRCPYAMRARMALHYSGVPVHICEVSLKAKPADMLAASPKGTVPVLVLDDGTVIDESLDIMRWALARNDPDGWLAADGQALIEHNDGPFKRALNCYKYADRHPEHPMVFYREQGCEFLQVLETRLEGGPWLGGEGIGLADIAIAPFIRQFRGVNPDWFGQAPYPRVREWIVAIIESDLFNAIMTPT
ncbi:glutathione S-transferase-like protein [Pseudomonas sp. M47T1]|uniref:glutathione S-transferase n=1 Tax=unclassified Pseudomonas TaxID=196821 RepID=UPI00026072B8|nr:glutathione S-transferase [Pseudomonas sp. M47T1]EIK94868.1 glutathione S-transferase-like protein [Pseudomonas sp. M47T1]